MGKVDTKKHAAAADRLVMAAIRLTRTLQWLGRGGPLTPPEIGALVVIVYAGSILARDLAAHQQVTAATMSRLLRDLEGRGLIDRKADKNDSRKQWIKATPTGAALVKREHERRLAPLVKIVGKLNRQELKGMTDASLTIETLTRAISQSR